MQFLLTRSFDKYIVLTCTEADIGIPPSISSAAIFLYYFILIRERNVGWKSIFIKYLLKKIELDFSVIRMALSKDAQDLLQVSKMISPILKSPKQCSETLRYI